jgi:hypothetical protein
MQNGSGETKSSGKKSVLQNLLNVNYFFISCYFHVNDFLISCYFLLPKIQSNYHYINFFQDSKPDDSFNKTTNAPTVSSGTPGKLSYPIEDYTPPSVNSTHDLRQTFSWNGLLSEPGFMAAPVAAFKHVR